MDAKVIEQLRRNQSLHTLADGREAVDVTLQFTGRVPALSRPERKAWLSARFSRVDQRLGRRIGVKPGSLSVSGQTIEAVVPVDELDQVEAQLAHDEFRLDVMVPTQVLDQGKG